MADYPFNTERRAIERSSNCRCNSHGFRDAATSCCLKIVEIGIGQRRDKPGHVSYLYCSPWVKCPVGEF